MSRFFGIPSSGMAFRTRCKRPVEGDPAAAVDVGVRMAAFQDARKLPGIGYQLLPAECAGLGCVPCCFDLQARLQRLNRRIRGLRGWSAAAKQQLTNCPLSETAESTAKAGTRAQTACPSYPFFCACFMSLGTIFPAYSADASHAQEGQAAVLVLVPLPVGFSAVPDNGQYVNFRAFALLRLHFASEPRRRIRLLGPPPPYCSRHLQDRPYRDCFTFFEDRGAPQSAPPWDFRR